MNAESPTKEPLRVTQLYAENVKKLKTVSIFPDPKEPIIKLTGKNRQGKTSFLEAVWMLLLGEKYIPPEPIRDGQNRAEAFIDLGEFMVRRVITPKGTTLTISGKEGFKAPSPQTFLASRLGRLVHNPLDFMRLKPDEQVTMLQELVNIQVDLEEFKCISGLAVKAIPEDKIALFDQSHGWLYKKRAEKNLEVKRLEGVVKSISVPEDWESVKAVTVAALFEERKALEETKRANDAVRTENGKEAERIAGLQIMLARKTEEIAELEKKLATLKDQVYDLQRTIKIAEGILRDAKVAEDSLEDPDFADIDARIATADATNQKAAKIEEWKKAREDLAAARAESESFTARMDAIKEYKTRLIAAAGMPVPGLGFQDGMVTYKAKGGIEKPLSQASGAEQIHVSCAVCMASHPEIGLLTIDKGWSELDLESQQTLRDWAAKIGCHVLVTKVCEEPEADGWHIVDGEVAAVNGQPYEASQSPPESAAPKRTRKKKGSGNGEDIAFEDTMPPTPAFMQRTGSGGTEETPAMPPRLARKEA